MNIIELAKEAGFWTEVQPVWEKHEQWIGTNEELERFAALVRAEVEAEWIETNKALAKEIIERDCCDLTDDEMWAVFISRDWTGEPLHLMSAVIAAFKEKQK